MAHNLWVFGNFKRENIKTHFNTKIGFSWGFLGLELNKDQLASSQVTKNVIFTDFWLIFDKKHDFWLFTARWRTNVSRGAFEGQK